MLNLTTTCHTGQHWYI